LDTSLKFPKSAIEIQTERHDDGSHKNKYASDIHKSGNLSLKEDNWTDINGDGKIDLVFAFTNYDEEHSSGVIMLLVNGKWKDIGSVRD